MNHRKQHASTVIWDGYPLGFRLKMTATRYIDRTGAWLCTHHCRPIARWLWRFFRML